jgi:hypothetical protein
LLTVCHKHFSFSCGISIDFYHRCRSNITAATTVAGKHFLPLWALLSVTQLQFLVFSYIFVITKIKDLPPKSVAIIPGSIILLVPNCSTS